MRSEHDDARLPWYPLRERVAAMERTVVEVRDRLSDEAHIPQPVQRPIPVVIGAMSEVGLTVAARHADVIAISGLRQIPGEPIGTFALASADDTAATMHGMRAAVDGREVVFDFLVQAVSIDRDPRQAAAELVRGTTGMTVEQILDSPFVVLAADADRLPRNCADGSTSTVSRRSPPIKAISRRSVRWLPPAGASSATEPIGSSTAAVLAEQCVQNVSQLSAFARIQPRADRGSLRHPCGERLAQPHTVRRQP